MFPCYPTENLDPTRHDDPSAKIWSAYITEAEKYDRILVQSWKSDMDSILIFVRIGPPPVTFIPTNLMKGRSLLGKRNRLHHRKLQDLEPKLRRQINLVTRANLPTTRGYVRSHRPRSSDCPIAGSTAI